MSENLAIIPARGGSRGLPRKNVRLVGGLPLIAHTILAARNARTVSRVVVSTDDSEIAAVAQRFGAQVIQRPAEISGDTASSESALLHALEHLAAQAYRPQLLTFLQCTSPLTEPGDIDGTVAALLEQSADSALAAAPFHHFLWKRDASGNAEGINHDKRFRPRRQDRQEQLVETGSVYVMRVEGFRQARHRFFGKTVVHVIPADRCLEIDDIHGLHIAEAILRRRQQEGRRGVLPARIGAVVFDFDGVFTDNRVYVDDGGRETVACSRADGMGVSMLRRLGVPMLVLSGETSAVVSARCGKLGIECMQGVADKLPALTRWCQGRGIELSSVVYLGNDINDVACLSAVGCGAAVADAHESARMAAHMILSHAGGQGAVRELADMICRHIQEQDDAKRENRAA